MKVILKADIATLGSNGDIKMVADGYARNYLIPRKLAWEATPQNLKIWEREKDRLEKEKQEKIKAATAQAEKIEKLALSIQVKVGESGKLFGSVTSADIAKLLADNGFTIDRHSIMLGSPIKEPGVYTIDAKLHPEVAAKVKVSIFGEKPKKVEEEVEAQPQAEVAAVPATEAVETPAPTETVEAAPAVQEEAPAKPKKTRKKKSAAAE
jgi:large subunit ribosomal protein L9